MYCPIASDDYTSLPSTGLCQINTETSEIETWWAENQIFTHEVVPIPKTTSTKERNGAAAVVGGGNDDGGSGGGGGTTEGSWLLTNFYDAGKKRMALAILDSENFSLGPVCRLNLNHHVTYGLHGSFAAKKSR